MTVGNYYYHYTYKVECPYDYWSPSPGRTLDFIYWFRGNRGFRWLVFGKVLSYWWWYWALCVVKLFIVQCFGYLDISDFGNFDLWYKATLDVYNTTAMDIIIYIRDILVQSSGTKELCRAMKITLIPQNTWESCVLKW